jgi:hypothetical protein
MFSAAEGFLGGAPEDKMNFAVAWSLTSGIAHGMYPRLFAHTSEESIGPNFAADDTLVGVALFHGDLLLVGMADTTNRALTLGLGPDIANLYSRLREHAKKRPRHLGWPWGETGPTPGS